MIVVDLICEYKHRFEGWFASNESLESQQAAGQIRCPVCDANKIERLPSAPFVGRRSTDRAPDTTAQELSNAKALLRTLVQKLEDQAADAEDVGGEFTLEVLRIHHGDAEDRPLRGTMTHQDIDSLLEEGIGVLPLPVAKEDLH
ncbi:DUF1178 family protein [Viridibacterium curvum]|uniref:DUF1178 family protein n=1 Tax=Viridibacterium curvum TaxID=1101404 RepID=A0ABP9QW01_9RHOO